MVLCKTVWYSGCFYFAAVRCLFTFGIVLFMETLAICMSFTKNRGMNSRKKNMENNFSTGQSFQIGLSVYLPVWVKYNGPDSPSIPSPTPHCLVIRPKVGMVVDSDS